MTRLSTDSTGMTKLGVSWPIGRDLTAFLQGSASVDKDPPVRWCSNSTYSKTVRGCDAEA